MRVGFVRVVENQRLYGDTYHTWFAGESVAAGARPGQFLMLRCSDLIGGAQEPSAERLASDPLLPRPMSYHRVRSGADGIEFSILYDVVGRGTAWLAQREPGDPVFAWGPLGRGYSVRPPSKNLLLVAGGIGIAPLVWLAEVEVAKGRSVVLIEGARHAGSVFPASLLPSEVEVVVTTEDGSLGRKGRATDVLLDPSTGSGQSYYEWADQVFACGPNAMFASMAELVGKHESHERARGRKSVQVLLESPMGCGTGICYGCAVFDRRGQPRLVCKDGPRFEMREIW